MRHKKSQPPPPPPPPPPEPADQEQPVNGVLVQLEPDPEAPDNHTIIVRALGNVRQTEVPALLGMARRATENTLGIGGR